jgi:hypothetical protein
MHSEPQHNTSNLIKHKLLYTKHIILAGYLLNVVHVKFLT